MKEEKKKVVILVENDLFQLEDMLLSIQSILFVATKQKLLNAPKEDDTAICVLHLLGKDEKAEPKTFGRFESILEDRQRELMDSDYGCKLNYRYETARIDRESYPPEDWDEGMKDVCTKIEEISQGCSYTIVLDVILEDDKDPSLVLDGGEILSHFLYRKYSGHCIPYTKYDPSGQKFRKKWAERVDGKKAPYERYCLDGNVIHKNFKQEIYKCLEIESRGKNEKED
ncbi:MAG: hypothetical protein NC123_01860 [Butyrivibrio sp.]|nr:hypothetical protein [Acetatifactor muris]MCM1558284.1 hypothetical protein [Butyrivibrio sp.]